MAEFTRLLSVSLRITARVLKVALPSSFQRMLPKQQLQAHLLHIQSISDRSQYRILR